MSGFQYIVLYVEDIIRSKTFYTWLLGNPPTDLSPTFTRYEMEGGWLLELWQSDHVDPAPAVPAGSGELCRWEENDEALQRTFAEWKERGVQFAQAPTSMVFGLTCVALDPDGHRFRSISQQH